MKKVVKNIATSTYGVYLFHENILFREFYMSGQFRFVVNYSEWLIPMIIIIIAVLIFGVGVLIDKIWKEIYRIFFRNALNKIFK